MTEFISESHFRAGQQLAVVRDIHGIRVGLRGIPRDHRVLLVGALTTHPGTGELDGAVGGERIAYLGDVDTVANAWTAMLAKMLEERGVHFGFEISNFRENGAVCPFHGVIHDGH